MPEHGVMAVIQTTDEISVILAKLEGEEVATLQVLGINSLKSVTPMPDALAGDLISSARVEERLLMISTAGHLVVVDLQRTGKLIWLPRAAPYAMSTGTTRPTVRLVLANGRGLDLIEPAKTKRITVAISTLA
jgi:hypothetical protein